MRRGVMVPEHVGNPSGGDGGVVLISATEIAKRLPLLGMGKPDVHPHQQREHDQRQDGGPLKEGPEHDSDESDVLRMPHVGIDAGGRELMLAIKGQAASSSHGNAPSTCAVCSVRRKKAATVDRGQAQSSQRKGGLRGDWAPATRGFTSFAKRPLSEVTTADVENIARKIGETHPRTANKLRALLSAVWNHAIRRGEATTNPVRFVERFSERSRERFLREDELPAFLQAVAQEPPTSEFRLAGWDQSQPRLMSSQ